MTLIYVTRTVVPSRAAQSLQIISMSKAFHHRLNQNFCLVSGKQDSDSSTNFQFRWEPHTAPVNPVFRYLRFCFIAIRYSRTKHQVVIFTRDIAIAFAVVITGGYAVFEAHKEPLGRIATCLAHWLSRCSRFKLVAISQALCDYYIHHFRVPPGRTLVAHDGVFPEDYLELRKIDKKKLRLRLKLPLDQCIVVHTGSLARGGAELFEHVLRAGQDEVFIVHMGGSESECKKWQTYYFDRGLKNIRFIPHQPAEQARLFQVAADVLFYVLTRSWPTYWCASPLKIFEYMASGVPIIGSNVGSISELINENNAFCFDPDQPSSLVEAWHRYRSDPVGAQKRVAKACEEAETLYSWYQRAERVAIFANASGRGNS